MLLPASGTSLYSRTGRQERPTRTSCYLAITVLTSACISDCCTHYYRPHASYVRLLWTGAQRRGAVSRTEPLRGVREENWLARQPGAGALKDHSKGHTCYPVCQAVHMLIYPSEYAYSVYE